jgi:DNA-binding MarR family transcriptional regulator
MTTRLRNILARNGIYFISQLGNYSKESYMKMRNLGEVAFQELLEVCVRYKVELSTVKLLEEDLQPVKFSTSQVLILYESGISFAKDFEDFTMEELQEKYGYDKRLYSGICKVIEEKGLRLRRRGKVARIIF